MALAAGWDPAVWDPSRSTHTNSDPRREEVCPSCSPRSEPLRRETVGSIEAWSHLRRSRLAFLGKGLHQIRWARGWVLTIVTYALAIPTLAAIPTFRPTRRHLRPASRLNRSPPVPPTSSFSNSYRWQLGTRVTRPSRVCHRAPKEKTDSVQCVHSVRRLVHRLSA